MLRGMDSLCGKDQAEIRVVLNRNAQGSIASRRDGASSLAASESKHSGSLQVVLPLGRTLDCRTENAECQGISPILREMRRGLIAFPSADGPR